MVFSPSDQLMHLPQIYSKQYRGLDMQPNTEGAVGVTDASRAYIRSDTTCPVHHIPVRVCYTSTNSPLGSSRLGWRLPLRLDNGEWQ